MVNKFQRCCCDTDLICQDIVTDVYDWTYENIDILSLNCPGSSQECKYTSDKLLKAYNEFSATSKKIMNGNDFEFNLSLGVFRDKRPDYIELVIGDYGVGILSDFDVQTITSSGIDFDVVYSYIYYYINGKRYFRDACDSGAFTQYKSKAAKLTFYLNRRMDLFSMKLRLYVCNDVLVASGGIDYKNYKPFVFTGPYDYWDTQDFRCCLITGVDSVGSADCAALSSVSAELPLTLSLYSNLTGSPVLRGKTYTEGYLKLNNIIYDGPTVKRTEECIECSPPNIVCKCETFTNLPEAIGTAIVDINDAFENEVPIRTLNMSCGEVSDEYRDLICESEQSSFSDLTTLWWVPPGVKNQLKNMPVSLVPINYDNLDEFCRCNCDDSSVLSYVNLFHCLDTKYNDLTAACRGATSCLNLFGFASISHEPIISYQTLSEDVDSFGNIIPMSNIRDLSDELKYSFFKKACPNHQDYYLYNSVSEAATCQWTKEYFDLATGLRKFKTVDVTTYCITFTEIFVFVFVTIDYGFVEPSCPQIQTKIVFFPYFMNTECGNSFDFWPGPFFDPNVPCIDTSTECPLGYCNGLINLGIEESATRGGIYGTPFRSTRNYQVEINCGQNNTINLPRPFNWFSDTRLIRVKTLNLIQRDHSV